MKYAFLVSIAVFAFLVSCGKKDKKLGQAGKTSGQAQSDCSGKNAETKECKEKAAKALLDAQTPIETSPDVAESGADTAKEIVETIPNVNDKDLKENSKMSIMLSADTSLIADLRVNADGSDMVSTKVICGDLKDPSEIKDTNIANPDKLTAVTSMILFNNSSIVADLSVNTGDKTVKPKTYMLSCNSGSSVKASDYLDANGASKTKEIEVKQLKAGQQTFELISKGSSTEKGLLTSFECSKDDDVLKNTVKSVGKKAANRIRLRVGSSVLVHRAVDVKEGEKKIKELGTDAQKEVKFSVVSCNG